LKKNPIIHYKFKHLKMSRELHALERDIEDRASEAVKRRAVDNQEPKFNLPPSVKLGSD